MRMKPSRLASSKLILAAALLGAALAAPAAEEDAWVSLGQASVTFRSDRDVLDIKSGRERFSKLKLEVEGNDIEIDKMIVEYGIGASDEIPVRYLFKEGSRSRTIDLRGRARSISKITFYYRTAGRLRDGRASIKVFGR